MIIVIITSGQSNWTRGCIAAAIVFNRWHQCALMGGHIGATESTTETANRSVHLTAESPYTLQWAPFPPKLPLPTGDLHLHLTRFLGPIQAHNPNSISTGSAIFEQMTAECPYTLQWDGPFTLQNCPFPWEDLDPKTNNNNNNNSGFI